MAQRKKTVRKSRATKTVGAHTADTSALVNETVRPEDAQKDMAAQERKEFMQRRAAEEKALKASQKVVSYHYELNGNKLIRKVRKANGSLYSFYVGNVKKQPALLNGKDVKEHLKK